ncbi:immune-induced peptide 23 [Drosophila sechellia]|uniref:GM19911 n=1 Tax=Drosophila sechellia TaxID=7238 RepID=B4HNM0_DROSE|nr:immune-induced peptide 23 [Drosophila sechellia]EDW48439.1 GM19911 [Drosophila sechellia]
MKCLILSFAIVVVLASQAKAGNVIIGGVCQDCSPPVAENVVVGGQSYRTGRPGQGTVYINSPGAYPGALDGPIRRAGASAGERGGTRYPNGYSGRLPGGTYLHNKDCVGCSISGGGD